ncbi:glycosyl transferase [Arthrobacter sp. ERGS1:01]|uniref:glycosyltransferase family A protein n=1 Tax=Arthrobacter sp. ERGS1:01 TaxID=1704044 RepID=UPI0006CB47E0|nr:glycosyltransferase family A protein [Arthrobacter sp. ERGS1:01]ALE05859.1 glycosyl transferase [Arthrobacter sp. ERGS1:01]
MTSIAVVIPSRNDAPMLAACLAHLAAQSRPADQIIVVDNGSTDNTAQLCEAAGVRRIHWPVPGVAGASAAGFDAAGTDIVARIDADSRPAPGWLARVESDLAAAGPLTLVTGPGDFYDGPQLVCWLGRTLYLGGYFHVVGFLLGHPPVFGSNYAMTAEVWARLGPGVIRDAPGIHDDLDVSYRVRPDMTVMYDAGLRMPVSARPFHSWGSLGRRLAMSGETFTAEFREEGPLRRRRARRQEVL